MGNLIDSDHAHNESSHVNFLWEDNRPIKAPRIEPEELMDLLWCVIGDYTKLFGIISQLNELTLKPDLTNWSLLLVL